MAYNTWFEKITSGHGSIPRVRCGTAHQFCDYEANRPQEVSRAVVKKGAGYHTNHQLLRMCESGGTREAATAQVSLQRDKV